MVVCVSLALLIQRSSCKKGENFGCITKQYLLHLGSTVMVKVPFTLIHFRRLSSQDSIPSETSACLNISKQSPTSVNSLPRSTGTDLRFCITLCSWNVPECFPTSPWSWPGSSGSCEVRAFRWKLFSCEVLFLPVIILS